MSQDNNVSPNYALYGTIGVAIIGTFAYFFFNSKPKEQPAPQVDTSELLEQLQDKVTADPSESKPRRRNNKKSKKETPVKPQEQPVVKEEPIAPPQMKVNEKKEEEQPKKKNKKNKPKKETTNVDSKPKETTTKPKKQNAKTKVEKEESEGEREEVGKSKKTNTNYQTLQQKIKANYDEYLDQF